MIGAIIFNIVMILALIGFLIYRKEKGKEMLKVAYNSLKKSLPLIILLCIILLFLNSLISETFLADQISKTRGVTGYLVAGALGAFVHIPLIFSFPISSQLLHSGVNPGFVAVLISSLVMVHIFSIPIEAKELGLKFSILRNSLSLVIAIIVGIIMGVFF